MNEIMNERGNKEKGAAKTVRLAVKPSSTTILKKPSWVRVKAGNDQGRFSEIKRLLRDQRLHTVCEEASCPNIGECFSQGTATFMILGDICTRRCPFCDVGHGRPLPADIAEPQKLAQAVETLQLKYVVITSVDRDDLSDGGADHFAACIQAIRQRTPQTQIEILVPDFRGRVDKALERLGCALPDVFNHNLETVPRLYREVRPGADYRHSLELLAEFKTRYADIPTKSGLMVGLGERDEEILEVMHDLRKHRVDMLTVGQYLAPSIHHLSVKRYVPPDTFTMFTQQALAMGFTHAACGVMVRSSYHAGHNAREAGIVADYDEE